MANFANSSAGWRTALAWAKAKMADKTWVNAHVAKNVDGNTIVRYQRFMSPTNPGYGTWVESRADDAT